MGDLYQMAIWLYRPIYFIHIFTEVKFHSLEEYKEFLGGFHTEVGVADTELALFLQENSNSNTVTDNSTSWRKPVTTLNFWPSSFRSLLVLMNQYIHDREWGPVMGKKGDHCFHVCFARDKMKAQKMRDLWSLQTKVVCYHEIRQIFKY